MMHIKIYQIDRDRDTNGAKFMNTEYLQKHTGKICPDSASYNLVFDGEVECCHLEDVFRMFNLDRPAEFIGHSLSVSDVVEVENSDAPSKFYFCDSFGFTEVPFRSKLTESKLPQQTIDVVLVEPGKAARTAKLGTSLADMQRAVGGYIQVVYPFDEAVCIVCNEEGKLSGLPLNRALRNDNGEMYDIVAGTFFICDCSCEALGSLNAKQLTRYTEKFRTPERFCKINGEIVAIPMKSRKEEPKR